MDYLISVIMGVLNAEDTLDESIQSIVNQTYKNWEFIICDDGSTDKTWSILMKYKNKYPDKFILLKNKKNLGLNKTLNNCLKKANGIFIARQDADDRSVLNRFEKQLDYLLNHKDIQIVSSNMIHFCNEKKWISKGKVIKYPTKKDIIVGSPICHAPVMMWKKCYDNVNGYSTLKSTLRVEDVDLWIKLYSKGYKCYNFDTPLYEVRDNLQAFQEENIDLELIQQ